MLLLVVSALLAQTNHSASATNEGAHIAGEYYVARSGASWTFADDSSKRHSTAKLTVVQVVNWLAQVQLSWGKRTTSLSWRVRDGAWVERRAGRESVVLPAVLSVGTRWKALASIESDATGESDFEVMSADATAELENKRFEHCLAVLETGGAQTLTHFYAPNVGKVAVQGNEGYLLKLVDYQPGRGAHGD